MKKKKWAFTIVEILVAMIILAILVSVSIAGYQKTLTIHNDRLCEQNLAALEAAIDVYTVEHDAMPDSFAKLEPRHIHLAYQKLYGSRKNILTACLKVVFGIKPLYAESLERYYNYNKKVLICPADPAGKNAASGYSSYDFNPNSMTVEDLSDYNKDDLALICDHAAYHKVYDSNIQDADANNKFSNAINSFADIGTIDQANTQAKKIKKLKKSGACVNFTVDKAHCCVQKKQIPKDCRTACKAAGYTNYKKPPCK